MKLYRFSIGVGGTVIRDVFDAMRVGETYRFGSASTNENTINIEDLEKLQGELCLMYTVTDDKDGYCKKVMEQLTGIPKHLEKKVSVYRYELEDNDFTEEKLSAVKCDGVYVIEDASKTIKLPFEKLGKVLNEKTFTMYVTEKGMRDYSLAILDYLSAEQDKALARVDEVDKRFCEVVSTCAHIALEPEREYLYMHHLNIDFVDNAFVYKYDCEKYPVVARTDGGFVVDMGESLVAHLDGELDVIVGKYYMPSFSEDANTFIEKAKTEFKKALKTVM